MMEAVQQSMPAQAMGFIVAVWQNLGTDIEIIALTFTFAMVIKNLPWRTKNKQSSKKIVSTKRAGSVADVGSTMASEWSPTSTGVSTRGQANSGRSGGGGGGDVDVDGSGSDGGGAGGGDVGVRCGNAGVSSSVDTLPPSNRQMGGDPRHELWQVVREQRGAKFAAWALHECREMQVDASQRSAIELYTTLMQCVINSGKCHLIEGIIDDMVQQKVRRPLAFYESAMKQLARQKQHHVALSVYDRLVADGLVPSAVTCSCLVSFAADVGDYERAVGFFENLSSMTTPSIRAYMTILRVHAKRQDWRASLATFRDMQKQGVTLDSPVLNIVLASGITSNFDEVEKLITEGEKFEPPILDLVSYNTLAKGYAQRNDASGAVGVISRMRARGLVPNSITFNTAMDAAAGGPHSDVAWGLLEEMRRMGMRPDKFTCSILVKAISKHPRPEKVLSALGLLHETDAAFDATLRSLLYQAVVEAAWQAGGGSLLVQVVTQMRQHDVQPTAATHRILHTAMGNAVSQPRRAKKV